MTTESFKDKPTKELEGTLKMLKIISYSLSVIIILLLSFTIYGMAAKEDNGTFVALFVVGLSCAAILPLQFESMKKIKNELKTRV
jgi:hypothetical protein